ncbi:portal protein [Bacillus phage vB_BcM_Sam46]|uniref:Portal protein n=1 Tax=Bacillus phage vB_BcM_Sam46 TaxID=2719179 RepID=A0A6G9L9A1_9CAUD|nr:portal protein [Bacillus phage vB_BcM_Sam46]
MTTFYKYAQLMDRDGVTAANVSQAIAEHAAMSKDAQHRFGRYVQAKKHTPIMNREFDGEAAKKINNKLANDYFGEIVDTKVGYMFGVPVTVAYDKSLPGYENVMKNVERFEKINNFDDFNAESAKLSAICGYSAALCYFDADGLERVKKIDPWTAIIISKTEMHEPEYGIIYYKTWEDKYRAEVYTKTNKIVFEGTSFAEADLLEIENAVHQYQYCPLFGIPNTAELQGDGDKVFSLIDGFDRSLSDSNNEIEQYRLAYLLFIGYEPDEEILREMVKAGALYVPSAADGEDIRWLVKDLNPAYVDSHLDRVEANITRFAKHVNFTDAAFGGDITGPAMRYKLFALETKSKYFERKHEAALRYMFKVIGSAWQVKATEFDFTGIDIKYTRNIPVNLLDEANTANALAAITSKETALGTLSVVPDVEKEKELINQEREEMLDLDLVPGMNPNDPNAKEEDEDDDNQDPTKKKKKDPLKKDDK